MECYIQQYPAAETAAYFTTKHPEYAILAARIAIFNCQKETKKGCSQGLTRPMLLWYVMCRPAGKRTRTNICLVNQVEIFICFDDSKLSPLKRGTNC